MTTITVATLNLWGQTGLWRERMELAARQLREVSCDALVAQETADNVETLAQGLGMSMEVLPTEKLGFGLAVMSRFELGEVRHLSLPGPEGEDRWLLSVHLPGKNTWLHCTHLSHELTASGWRQKQVLHIADAIAAGDSQALHVLGGDMNALPESDEMRFLRGLCSIGGSSTHMQDCWLRHHREDESGYTWCMQEGEERRQRSIDVDRRLDYLYASSRRKDRQGEIEDSGKVCHSPGASGFHASDHCGVWARVHLGP
jgi:endonuclease/exonuclease/phosphatase family metal-dependent hydrolase